MKNSIFILFFLTFTAFGQNENSIQTIDLKVVGSISYGTQQVTTLTDVDGCFHKTIPHSFGLFILDEIVKMKLNNDNSLMGELIKENLEGSIFATRSCNQNSTNLFKEDGLFLPVGSEVTEIYDSYGNIIELYCVLPQDFVFVGNVGDDKIITASNVTLTCTCTGSGICQPFVAAGQMGCKTENCKTCIGKTTGFATKETFDFYFVQNGIRTPESDLTLLSDSRTLYTYEEWLSYPFVTTSEINSPEFRDILKNMIEYTSNFGVENLVAVAIIVKGKKMILNVPYNAVEKGGLYCKANTASSSTISCSGSCGTNNTVKCKLETAALGQVSYCGGCASGCAITIK